MCCEIPLAAAYELDYFVAVTRGDTRFCPLGMRQNIEVALDGHAAAFEP